MFAQMLYTQWKWAKTELLIYVFAGFLIPTIIIRIGYAYVEAYSVRSVLGVGAFAGVFFCLIAILAALGLAWRPYILDASLRHVGPLSLPIPWSAFVRLRFLAGATLLVIPTIAVWLGGILATASVPIPPTLHPYPGGIAIRFFLAALITYSAGFLLQYVAGKHAVKVAIALFLLVIGVELIGELLGYSGVWLSVWNGLTDWAGPFSIFSARWMLIDV